MTEQEWKEWEKYAAEYNAAVTKAVAEGTFEKGWAHSGCDHAAGYCAETATNIYEGVK